MTDFITHSTFGTARLSPGQRAHLHLHMRAARVSLADPVAARYLRDWSDDDTPPTPAAPALPVPRCAA